MTANDKRRGMSIIWRGGQQFYVIIFLVKVMINASIDAEEILDLSKGPFPNNPFNCPPLDGHSMYPQNFSAPARSRFSVSDPANSYPLAPTAPSD